jgi:hypothetical protein
MSTISTSTLLPSVLKEQINFIIDELVDLQLLNEQGELTAREFATKSEELWEQKETLESQLANW